MGAWHAGALRSQQRRVRLAAGVRALERKNPRRCALSTGRVRSCLGGGVLGSGSQANTPPARGPNLVIRTFPRRHPRGPPAGEGLKDAVLDVAAAAKAHLAEARALAPKLPKGAPPLLLQAPLVGGYLSALQARGFDVFHPELPAGGLSPLRRAVAVKWHSLRGTY